MKKVLLSILAVAAFSASTFAQNARTSAVLPSANSGNVVNVDGNMYTYAFKGAASDNCVGTSTSPATFPVTANSGLLDLYGGVSTYFAIDSVGNGSLTYTIKAGTPVGTNLLLRFLAPDCGYSSQVVDLSDVTMQGYSISYKSSAAFDATIMVLGNMPGGNAGSATYGDLNVTKSSFVAGSGTLKGNIQDSTYQKAPLNVANSGAFAIQIQSVPANDITLKLTSVVFGTPTVTTGVVDYTYATTNSTVYPNPVSANEPLTVTGLSGSVSLKLMNSTGSTVASSESASLQLNNVNSGLYFLEVNNNGTLRTEKIMVK